MFTYCLGVTSPFQVASKPAIEWAAKQLGAEKNKRSPFLSQHLTLASPFACVKCWHLISFGCHIWSRGNKLAQTLVCCKTSQFQLLLRDLTPIIGRNRSEKSGICVLNLVAIKKTDKKNRFGRRNSYTWSSAQVTSRWWIDVIWHMFKIIVQKMDPWGTPNRRKLSPAFVCYNAKSRPPSIN